MSVFPASRTVLGPESISRVSGVFVYNPRDCRWQYTNPMTVPRVTKACPYPRKRLPCPGRAHCQNTTMTHSRRSRGLGGGGGTHHFRGCGISLLSCHVSTESFSLFGLKLGEDQSLLRPLPKPPHRAPRAREKEGHQLRELEGNRGSSLWPRGRPPAPTGTRKEKEVSGLGLL